MKITTIVIIILFNLAAINVFAQMDLAWQNHNIGFKAPDDFKITNSDIYALSAGNDKITLELAILENESTIKTDFNVMVSSLAEAMEYKNLTESKSIVLGALNGYFVESKKEDSNTIIMILINSNNNNTVLALIKYSNENDSTIAHNIASSFHILE